MSETVKPGQVWADNDPRSAGRTLRVERIDGAKAICTILTNVDSADISSPRERDMRGKTTRISLARFRPTSTGYRLIEDTPDAAGAAPDHTERTGN